MTSSSCATSTTPVWCPRLISSGAYPLCRAAVANHATNSDPHTVAGLFKMWLSELSQPLLTYAMYSEFMTAMKLDDAQRVPFMQRRCVVCVCVCVCVCASVLCSCWAAV
jgi:hypothetical protein